MITLRKPYNLTRIDCKYTDPSGYATFWQNAANYVQTNASNFATSTGRAFTAWNGMVSGQQSPAASTQQYAKYGQNSNDIWTNRFDGNTSNDIDNSAQANSGATGYISPEYQNAEAKQKAAQAMLYGAKLFHIISWDNGGHFMDHYYTAANSVAMEAYLRRGSTGKNFEAPPGFNSDFDPIISLWHTTTEISGDYGGAESRGSLNDWGNYLGFGVGTAEYNLGKVIADRAKYSFTPAPYETRIPIRGNTTIRTPLGNLSVNAPKLANGLKWGGRALGAGGIVITAYQAYYGDIGYEEAALDASFGVVGFFGPVGFVVSSSYFFVAKPLYNYYTKP